MMRRVRSSKCGQTERNFRFNSDRVFTSAKLNAMTPRLIPLFIYRALVSPVARAEMKIGRFEAVMRISIVPSADASRSDLTASENEVLSWSARLGMAIHVIDHLNPQFLASTGKIGKVRSVIFCAAGTEFSSFIHLL